MTVKLPILTGVSLLLFSSAVVAEELTEASQSAEELKQAQESKAVIEQAAAASDNGPGKAAQAWIPSAVEYDWVQLTSNEWLKGEIKGMYKDSLEFDSDKLDLLNIDWKDVKILRSYRDSSINIEGVGCNLGRARGDR